MGPWSPQPGSRDYSWLVLSSAAESDLTAKQSEVTRRVRDAAKHRSETEFLARLGELTAQLHADPSLDFDSNSF